MDCNNDYSPERKGVEIPSCEIEPHLLISSVRKSYLKYMTRLLCENYVGWCGERPPKDVLRAAREMELKAAAKAMMVPLYRAAILSMIKSVKKCTANQDLCPEVEDCCVKSRSRTKATQTDLIDSSVLQQTSISRKNTAIENTLNHKIGNKEPKSIDEHKINVSQNSGIKSNDSNKSAHKLNESDKDIFDVLLESSVDNATSKQSKRCSKLSISSADDDLMLEMEKLFKTDNADGEDDIFDSFMGDNQVKMILEEINQYGNTAVEKSQYEENDSTIVEECDVRVNGLAVGSSSSLEKRLEEMMKPVGCSVVSSTQPPPKKKYVYSRWPCELYYQKKKLQVKLDQICEQSLKLHAKVKERFVDLFGYDSSDEEAMQSPDTSEPFLRSCQQRAAPHVVRHLQPYLHKGRLPRNLCRPLASHLLHLLVNVNQYPDDYECFLFVKEYFHRHPRIRCMADF